LPDVPIHGYGAMLFLAFVSCTWLACWLAVRQGIPREPIQDLAIWVFISGIVGARITFMLQYHDRFTSPWQFFFVWDGGLVFYGSFFGGAVGFLLAYRFQLRRHGIRFWQMADICACCLALGLCLGRVGCLLNGCCYGNVACPDCPGISFPMYAESRVKMTAKGYQTAAGFILDERADGRTVGKVEKDSPADRAGLRAGDVIEKVIAGPRWIVGDRAWDIRDGRDLNTALVRDWPRGAKTLSLVVRRQGPGAWVEVPLPDFEPWTIRLHPTQVYESISMALLLMLLLAYLPFRRHEGEAIALFMICYAVHRFLNEILRDDTDLFADGMTLSQNISLLIFAAGVVIWLWLWLGPGRREASPAGGEGLQGTAVRAGTAPAAP
jgi:phosphatidylglycerol:prolipoprotein diacylglycerol transferase